MSRQLPTKPNDKQKLIIRAVADYYGSGITADEKVASKIVALFLMNRKARLPELTDEQKSDMWAIKVNLEDKGYCDGLLM